MVNINKKYLDENLKKAVWNEFLKEIKKADSEQKSKELFNKILTSSEQIMIEKRLIILHLLKKQFKYRQIGQMIDVTSQTISFIKNGLTRKKRRSIKQDRSQKVRLESKDYRKFRYPTFTGKGRWRFLQSL